MNQEEIKWEYDSDCDEWTGRISVFEFSVYGNGYGGFFSVLTDPFHLNFDGSEWSNLDSRPLRSVDEAKRKCDEYISGILSQLVKK